MLISYVKLDHTLYSINYGTPYAHQELMLHQVIDLYKHANGQ